MANSNKIYVPQILIPKWIDIPVQANIGLHGEMEWELVETKRFRKPVVIRRGKQHNIVVNAGIANWLSSSSSGIWLHSLSSYFAVGTGTSAPAVTQTALDVEISRVSRTSYTTVAGTPPYIESKYTFQENQANGDLTEWGTFRNSSGAPMFSRELFRDGLGSPVVVTKTNTQVLNITYRLYIKRSVDSTSVNKIVGATTYTCVTTINDNQLYKIATDTIFYTTLYYTRTGTSNATSDLVNDLHNTIKGTVLFGGTLSQAITKTFPTSTQALLTLNFGSSESNGQIGEVLVPVYSLDYGARVTFNPTITKDSTKKLQVAVLFTFGDI